MSVIYYVRFSDENEKKRVVNLQVVFVRVVYYFYFQLPRDVIKTTSKKKSELINEKNLNNALMFYVRITVLCKQVKLNCL